MVSERYKRRAQELRDIIITISGLDPMEDTRKRDVVTARMMLAVQLIREGCTLVQVAELLGRNHSSIVHYENRIQLISLPGWEAERELWEIFKARI